MRFQRTAMPQHLLATHRRSSFIFNSAPTAAVARARCLARAPADADAEADDASCTNGFFDSSHDLSRGLAVTEHCGGRDEEYADDYGFAAFA